MLRRSVGSVPVSLMTLLSQKRWGIKSAHGDRARSSVLLFSGLQLLEAPGTPDVTRNFEESVDQGFIYHKS